MLEEPKIILEGESSLETENKDSVAPTVESEQDPDLKMNTEIWNEMKEGNFENTYKLTRITSEVSKYLKNIKGDIDLRNLTSAQHLVLPTTINGNLYLQGLTSTQHLVLPTTIKGYLYFLRLPADQERDLFKKYPQHKPFGA